MSEEFIYARLTGTPAVTALVNHRVYPNAAPTGSPRPYVVYNRITTLRVRSTKGRSGLASPRYQIDAWADSAASAKQVLNECILSLDGYIGTLANVRVSGVITDDQSSDQDAETGLYRHRADFIIWHYE